MPGINEEFRQKMLIPLSPKCLLKGFHKDVVSFRSQNTDRPVELQQIKWVVFGLVLALLMKGMLAFMQAAASCFPWHYAPSRRSQLIGSDRRYTG